MLLVETTKSRITEILNSDRPVALMPAENRDRAKEVAIAARDAGFGVGVIEDRTGRLLVLVVGDAGHEAKLRLFVRRYGSEIATDRNVDVEKVYVPASWMARLAKRQGAEVVGTL